jgi:hypothetical protein
MAMLLGVALRSRIAAVMLIVAVAALAAVGGVVPPTRTDMPQSARTSAPASHLTFDRTVITTR